MKQNAAATIKKTIIDAKLIQPGSHIIIGLSGGPDSVCLFHVLNSLRIEMGFSMSAVHVNHNFRPGDSFEDAVYCKQLCDDFNTSFYCYSHDVPSLVKSWGVTDEEAGRKVRYKAFFETAEMIARMESLPFSMIRVAVAHNKNDQAETVLMRVIRGTGTNGLAAMPYIRCDQSGFDVIRPLLDVDRNAVEDYCADLGLEPRRDHTNEEPLYRRNRLRLDLIPKLSAEYNSGIVETLCRLASNAACDRDYFDEVTDEILIKYSIDLGDLDIYYRECEADGEGMALPLQMVAELHPAVRRRLIVKCFNVIGLSQDIDAVHLQSAEELIMKGKSGKRLDFPSGYVLLVEYEKLVFLSCAVDSLKSLGDGKGMSIDLEELAAGNTGPANFKIEDIIATLSVLPNEQRECIEFDNTEDVIRTPSAGETIAVSFDADQLLINSRYLEIRLWKAGDRIMQLGMAGSKKLQDVFTDCKTPQSERGRIPLLVSDNEILVVMATGDLGRKSRNYPVSASTERILRLVYRRT